MWFEVRGLKSETSLAEMPHDKINKDIVWGFRVLGFKVEGLGFRVWGIGSQVQM